jgi:hypothetical protein
MKKNRGRKSRETVSLILNKSHPEIQFVLFIAKVNKNLHFIPYMYIKRSKQFS